MRRIALFSCIAATLLLSACKSCTPTPAVCTPPTSHSLAVPLRGQETNVWCWAATTEMVADYLGTNVTQCDCANKYTSRSDCCNSPTPGPCVTTGWPVFGSYGITFSQTSGTALSFDQIKEQTYCKKSPVAFIWYWTGGGGHIMVAKGYKTVAGTNYVHMNDPWPPNVGTISYITYSKYVSEAGSHTHGDDFYNFVK